MLLVSKIQFHLLNSPPPSQNVRSRHGRNPSKLSSVVLMWSLGFHLLEYLFWIKCKFSAVVGWGGVGGEWWVENYSRWNKQGVLQLKPNPQVGFSTWINWLSHNCTLLCLILVYLFSILSALGSSVLYFGISKLFLSTDFSVHVTAET